MEIDCVAIEAFAIVARMDFVQYVVEFDLVVVFEPKPFVAVKKTQFLVYLVGKMKLQRKRKKKNKPEAIGTVDWHLLAFQLPYDEFSGV